MKTNFLFLLLFESLHKISGDQSLVSLGINQVIREYYVKRDERFDIFIVGKKTNELSSLVNDIVTVKSLDFPYQLHTITEINKKFELKSKINRSAVVLCETFLACSSLFLKPYPYNMPNNGHYLIYMKDINFYNKKRLKELSSTEQSIQFSYLIEESDEVIKLMTLQMFHQPNCREWKEIEVNKITKKEKVWTTSEFFPKRFKNFNGCKLNVAAIQRRPPYMSFKRNNNSETGFEDGRGFVIKINEAIADSLYFKSQYFVKVPTKEYFKSADFVLNVLAQRKARVFTTILTHPISTKRDIFLIPPCELYTPFEKLFLPFDYDTWKWMIITFSSGIVTIVVLKFVPRKIRNFVVGLNVQSPMMNMMIVWFGGGQAVLPRRNFARYLLAMFLIFSLIMRTAYQGVQFEMLQKEMRRQQTVWNEDDLLDQGFEIYIPSEELNYLSHTSFYQRVRQRDLPNTSATSYMSTVKELLSVGSKKAVFIYDVNLNYFLSLEDNREEFQPKILDQIFGTDLICMQFTRFQFIYEIYDEIIVKLDEAGIIGKFVRDETEVHLRPSDDGPKVLTLDDLSTGFQVWLFFVAVSMIVFLLEWIFFLSQQKFMRIIERVIK